MVEASRTHGVLMRTCCSGYFEKTKFIEDVRASPNEINFYDSNTGNLLFTAPKGRTMEEFLKESRAHGWPSFRGTLCLRDICSRNRSRSPSWDKK